jgi:hypothetical protein
LSGHRNILNSTDKARLNKIHVTIGKKKEKLPDWKTKSPGNCPNGIFLRMGQIRPIIIKLMPRIMMVCCMICHSWRIELIKRFYSLVRILVVLRHQKKSSIVFSLKETVLPNLADDIAASNKYVLLN